MKKILFFMWSFSLGGGAEKILSTIANGLDKDKYKIDILEMEHFDKGFEKVPKGTKIRSFSSYKYPYLIRSLLWRSRIYFPNLVRKLLVKDKYDIEISFVTMNPPFKFSSRKDVLKIAWIHGSIEDLIDDEKKINSHRKQLSKADYIVAISEKTKESIELVFPEFKDKIKLIYNGYKFEDILNKAEEDVEIDIHDNSICSIGRIENLKGSDRVLEILKKLHKAGSKTHLYFIGTGELDDKLKAQSKKYGLEEFVHFLGYQKNPYKYLRHMKCLVSMSLKEGFPGVFVEAISLGVPFVSTDVGGAKELSCNGKFGDIIKTDDEAVEKIKHRIDKRLDKSDCEEFLSKYTVDNQINEIEKLFEMKYE